MSVSVITVVHPLAGVPRSHQPDTSAHAGYTRAAIPTDPAEQSAPAAAVWLNNPHETVQQRSIQDLIERWSTEPRYAEIPTVPPESFES